VGQKTGPFLKVYNFCIWWHRTAFNISKYQLFTGSKTDILNVAIFKYSLHKIRETILHRKYQLLQATKTVPFLTVCNSCMMTQKADPYTKLFSSLSGVRMMSCILSLLNILGSNLVKPGYTKMTIHSLFTRSHVTAILTVIQRVGFHRSGVIHTSKRSLLYQEYEECLNFTAVRYSLHKCSETIFLKRQLTVGLYTCHPYPVHWGSRKQEKTCHRVVRSRSSIWSIPYSGRWSSEALPVTLQGPISQTQ